MMSHASIALAAASSLSSDLLALQAALLKLALAVVSAATAVGVPLLVIKGNALLEDLRKSRQEKRLLGRVDCLASTEVKSLEQGKKASMLRGNADRRLNPEQATELLTLAVGNVVKSMGAKDMALLNEVLVDRDAREYIASVVEAKLFDVKHDGSGTRGASAAVMIGGQPATPTAAAISPVTAVAATGSASAQQLIGPDGTPQGSEVAVANADDAPSLGGGSK